MKTPTISTLIFFLSLVFSWSCAASADGNVDGFLECLKQEFHNYSSISSLVYTPINSSFQSVLDFSVRNLRFMSDSTPKPQVIITPEYEDQIPLSSSVPNKINWKLELEVAAMTLRDGLMYLKFHL
ncbi:UNVERIFIED_CONTAM: Cannabidiolic acid synthase [Sesamum radiatum]|uniref:Cannabidiolic acid synthase n=1 Tax=Sesamum radiatum TaxID=300843 RepID=A0AAW2T0P9_SESRA